MMKRLLIALAALNLGLFSVTNAQFAVTNNSNPTQLAQTLAGTGVTISNATKNCPNTGTGTFSGGNNTLLGVTSGVYLTTGNTATLNTAASNQSSIDNANGTDADLNAIVSPNTVQDVCKLEFDLIVQGNTLSFRYVFASDEYPEFVCSNFNDVFGFFVSGNIPGGGTYNNQNIAIIPGSNPQQAVSIGSVNPGVPGATYSPLGCSSLAYSSLYQNNAASTNLIFDGMTVILTATIPVIPCEQYHIKLAVADVFDGIYDSGVFLEATSFTSQPITVTPTYDFGLATAYEGCNNGLFTINIPNLATTSTPITYTMSGTGTNGVDYTNLPGTVFVNPGTSTALVYVDPIVDGLPEGTETVTITVFDPCTGLPAGSATINIEEPPLDTAYASRNVVCAPGDQVQLTASGGGTYAWSPPTGLSSTTSATPTATVTGPETYNVTITLGNCVSQYLVNVDVTKLELQALDSADITICPGTTVTIGANADSGIAPITYQWSPAGEVSNPTSPVVSVTPTVTTTYTVTATETGGCSVSADVTVNVDTIAQVEFGDDVNLCPENAPYTLGVPGGPYTTYIWSNGLTTPTIQVSTTDSFSVTVTNSACTFESDTIAVIFYQPVNPDLNDTGYCAGTTLSIGIADTSYTNVLWSSGSTNDTVVIGAPGTYYYTANDSNGCAVFSDTITVTEYLSPTANITASEDTLCLNETATLYANAANATTYLWTPGNGTADTLVVTGPGVYILTASNPACSISDTFEIFGFVNPNPLVGADTTVCSGDSVVFRLLNGPFQTYVWSNGVTGVDSIITNVPGTYTLTVFDGNCTWASNGVTLTNFITPVPTLSDTGACTGTPITLGAEPGLVNVVWSNGSNGLTVVITADDTALFYTAQDVNGCLVASDTVSVTFEDAPTVNLTASPDTICFGSTSLLNANATGTNLSYTWAPVASSNPTLTVSQAGTYYVTVTNGFCPIVDSVTVYQFPYTDVLTNNDTTVCPGEDVVVSVSGTYTTYQWNNGAQTPTITTDTVGSYWVVVSGNGCTYTSDTFTLSNFTVTEPLLADTGACTGDTIVLTAEAGLTNVVWSLGPVGPTLTVTGPGEYWYNATDLNGCDVVSDTSNVTFLPAPGVNLTAAEDTICFGSSTVLSANGTGTNLTYLWAPSGDTTSTITVSTAGTYIVTVSNGFCPSSDTIVINQFTTVPVTVSADTTVCPGERVTVSVNGGPFDSYSWFPAGNTATITVSTAGDYYVVVTDGTCSYTSDTFTLSNFTVATPTAYNDTTVCTNEPVTLTSDAGYTNYLWTPGAQPGATVTVTTAGAYFYTALDTNGCTVTSTTVTVTHTAPPSANITASPSVICTGQGGTTLTAPGVPGVVYTFNGTTVANSIQVTAAGTYTLTADSNGCVNTGSITITEIDTPRLALQTYTVSCCQQVVLNPGFGGVGYTYNWSNNTTADTLLIESTGNDTAYYTVTVTRADGCTAVQEVAVRIKCIDLNVTASPDSIVAGSETSQLVALTGYDDVTFNYIWTPAATLTDSAISNPVASPTEATSYFVTVTDSVDGCVDTASVTVFIKIANKFKMPNAFSPNGDAHNETFFPYFPGDDLSVTEFRIYNRWGALVHNTTTPWDGVFNGAMQPTGTFIYYITVMVPADDNPSQLIETKQTGSFTLLH